jgi:hypothetical protein
MAKINNLVNISTKQIKKIKMVVYCLKNQLEI